MLITERPIKRLSAGIDPGKAAWLEVDGGESGAFSSEGTIIIPGLISMAVIFI